MINKFLVGVSILLLVGMVNADCPGYLEVLDIGDRVEGEVITVIARTNENNTNQTRNLDLSLYDPNGRVVGTVFTQFDMSTQESQVEARIDTHNFPNGTYYVKADMRVYDSNNGSILNCAKMEFSNDFKIRSTRQPSSSAPFKFDITQELALKDFFYSQRSCANGLCMALNVSGYLPENMSIIPQVNWATINGSYNSNVAITPDICYEYSFVKVQSDALANVSTQLALCNERFANKSIEYQDELLICKADVTSRETEKSVCLTDRINLQNEFSDYKNSHPYEPGWFGSICFIAGIVALYVFAAFKYRKKAEKSPTEDVQ